MKNKEYIGDSVYAAIDPMGLVLTTENGLGPSNTIYLEPEVLDSLIEYCARHEIIAQSTINKVCQTNTEDV